MQANSDIIGFLEGKKRVGRHDLLLDEILEQGDSHLELCHDYIQWLFPTPERSAYNMKAPVLDKATGLSIMERGLDVEIIKSYNRMLSFYNIMATSNGMAFENPPPGMPADALPHWCSPNDHNHLRLTRIIRCLRLIGQAKRADSLYLFLKGVHDRHGDRFATPTTLAWWKKANESDSWEPMR